MFSKNQYVFEEFPAVFYKHIPELENLRIVENAGLLDFQYPGHSGVARHGGIDDFIQRRHPKSFGYGLGIIEGARPVSALHYGKRDEISQQNAPVRCRILSDVHRISLVVSDNGIKTFRFPGLKDSQPCCQLRWQMTYQAAYAHIICGPAEFIDYVLLKKSIADIRSMIEERARDAVPYVASQVRKIVSFAGKDSDRLQGLGYLSDIVVPTRVFP